MSLVIAHACDDIGFMVGDTLLSHERFQLRDDIGPVNGEFHGLKIQVLNGTIAVAYAGHFQSAYRTICDLYATLKRTPSLDPVQGIVDRPSLDQCEFLVLLNESHKKQLFRIADHQAQRCERAYIGDQDEYHRFSEIRRPYEGPPVRHSQNAEGSDAAVPVTEGEKEFDVVSNALEALTRERVGRKHPTVGAISGCVIRVVDARISRDLEYLQAVEVSHFPWEPHSGYTLLASNTDHRGVGIYFRSGHRGFVLPVCGDDTCVALSEPTLDSFVAAARDRFGMHLIGGTW
ncbi:hypothetical protein KMZ29_19070 [Bradyrhizobium sediminis]|uniref:Uncharacterized protein n=1 Tax=Bradyrhizobium sediminis TaxID=2840469 RepID=A0A975NC82_9BRAD|nr:hypothetical protein [Bradyrhizobium sediminis]QWG11814.1 hypothetical protein KMZ29_19070 [Bradyrhizobium sediminis]